MRMNFLGFTNPKRIIAIWFHKSLLRMNKPVDLLDLAIVKLTLYLNNNNFLPLFNRNSYLCISLMVIFHVYISRTVFYLKVVGVLFTLFRNE